MVLRSVHMSRARTLHYDVDGATVVTVSARLHTRPNHLQVGGYARKHGTAGARVDVFENDVVEWIAFPLSQTQQRLVGSFPAIHQQTLLLFSSVPRRQKPRGKLTLFRPVVG